VLSGCWLLAVTAFTVHAQPLTFTTFAGSEGGPGSADGTAGAARFNSPHGVATDSGGNVYVADQVNHTIRKITPAGVVTTLAGTAGLPGSSDGRGGAARFDRPEGVATDSGGNVYVAVQFNHTIRKITPAGVVTTLAGSAGFSGSADGTGSAARFNNPTGVAIDSGGYVFVADNDNDTIRKITPAGVVTTVAGSPGLIGSADGTGSAARFKGPHGVATDSAGNVYVADQFNRTIRKITPAGVVTTLAGLAGQSGSVDGPGSAARFADPRGTAADSAGNVYVADEFNYTIRKITPAGVVTTLAGFPRFPGSDDGARSAARFYSPQGVAVDSGGNVYVADQFNNTIRKITPAGVVTTLAGLASIGSADGTGTAARFNSPNGVAIDSGGNLYVADQSNYTIRKITAARVVTTFAGSAGQPGFADGTGDTARFGGARGTAVDSGGNVYVADQFYNTVRKITAAGVVTTLAGTAGLSGSADGTGSAARFNSPQGVAVDSGLNVYVMDQNNHTIRKITAAGVVSTLAGSAGVSGSADGTGDAARFNRPIGAATDRSGNVYVSDQNNNTIRKITPAGVVTTLAGLAGLAGDADGTGSAARFNDPIGVTTDSAGSVYVADTLNGTIRKITPAGVVTTVAGSSDLHLHGSADGTGDAARFGYFPFGFALDSGGNMYVVDNHKIRVGRPALADVARIDVQTGNPGTPRQLDTSSQTATSWQWTQIRQPSTSTALLSSTSIRNPIFTPDVADLFVFQLTAFDGVTTSITTVDLTSRIPDSRRRAVRH
jgi:hypothetical protein